MNRRKGLTRVEVIVTAAGLLLLAVNLQAFSGIGRERAKREVCLANLRMLTAAWQMYANDNAGKIVNGGQPPQNNPPPTEPYWCTPLPPVPMTDEVGTFPTVRYDWQLTLPYAERVSLLKRGALFKYVQDAKIYRCPEADKDMHRSYIIPQSMNAHWAGGATEGAVAKNMGQINKPKERVVFFEEKRLTPDAFMFPYDTNPATVYWDADKPQVMHGHGINLGFADGHAEYHKWECQSTIELAECESSCLPYSSYRNACGNNVDAKWMLNAVWGVTAQ